MTKKDKKKQETIDLEKCETLEHLKEAPKARSKSISEVDNQKFIIPPPQREFDDMTAFEAYIRDETWDNEFDYCHAKLKYYPPFVLKECHNDTDKIKPTMNRNNNKFKRHLHQHIEKHLMHDMEKASGFKMDFQKMGVEDTASTTTWKYLDEGLHGFTKEEEDKFDRHWKLEMKVTCNNENAMVEVDYMAIPTFV